MAQLVGVVVLPRWDRDPAEEFRLWTQLVGGLPLLLRQARLLKAAGCERIYLCGDERHERLLSEIRNGRLGLHEARFLTRASQLAPRAPDSLAGGTPTEPTVLLSGDCLFNKSAVARAVQCARRSARARVFALSSGQVGLVAEPRGQLLPGLAHFDQRLGHADSRAGAAEMSLVDDSDVVSVVRNSKDILDAERRLWDGCRKEADGLIAKYLDRHISLAVSRRLAPFAVSPNSITVANALLGIMAAILVGVGGYWPVFWGAVLFQLNSILDGVDGELARMRFESSVLGEWLDTIGDDMCQLLFFAALGYGAWRQTGSDLWLWMAGLFVAPMIAVSLIYYTELVRIGRGDLLATPLFQVGNPRRRGANSPFARLLAIGTKIFRKDMIVFVSLGAAILGIAHYVLVVVVIGMWIILATQIVGKFVKFAPRDSF